ncbi:MAG: chloramphenicol acetyltransferase [Oscillospiraceae bacterium]|nr:chloramphenicol acetyltransferase [Oscillospiraceae bacterium]
MQYRVIDIDNWKRGKLFREYIDGLRMVMSLTVDVDVTNLIRFCKEHGLKFYPAMMHVVSSVINAHSEFKHGWDESGNLIEWETVFPLFAEFHPEDEAFTRISVEYCEDLFEFCACVEVARDRYRHLRGFEFTPPKNTFDVSCLPWVKYRHVDMHVFDAGKYLSPSVTWGKYDENGIMPLSMNLHHAVADGFHLSRFFNEVQERILELK